MDPLDIEVLRAHVLKKDRSWVLAHPEYVLSKREQSQLEDCLKRRQAGEPVAYILGEKEFYGRMFAVDPRVLIPRPSTEGLIDLVKNSKFQAPNPKRNSNSKFQISKIDTGIVGVFLPLNVMVSPCHGELCRTMTFVDIGTGSGCIAITLALELPDHHIVATDIHADALEVARKNAKRHNVLDSIGFRKGNLLEPVADLHETFFVVSNPPYVSTKIPLPPLPNPPPEGEGIFYEPPLALFAGHKGTDVLIPLVEQAKKHPYCMGIFLECQEDQVKYLLSRRERIEVRG